MKFVVAFFDVDETVITIKSMIHFYKYWCNNRSATDEYHQFNEKFTTALQQGISREELNKMYYRQFKGVDINALICAGEKWHSDFFSNSELFIQTTISILNEHQNNGHQTVFVSGSMLPLLRPLAKQLGVDAILCTNLEVAADGELTGEIVAPQTIGEGKKEAMLSYLSRVNIPPENCFSYGDDLSDIPMLSVTGNPVCIGGVSALAEYARNNDWTIIS
ncbi:HAD-IB family hydrolase [Atlantibacter subterranea]|uniref:HAD family hydrolase n=1 Tax=Atlantibacter subterraneus TaxID=255519 RepID=UPI0020C32F4E|nr:HAD-IB family hydrolase [Atlantibacter subterranea]UTJ46770.1 HAD-IB family hydrolase [Atlantibacter subterranea]